MDEKCAQGLRHGQGGASLWGNTALSVKAVTEIFAALLMKTIFGAHS